MVEVDSSEILARFIFSIRMYRADNSIRHTAFMPNPKNNETSVFRISDISDDEIWEIGDSVGVIREKPILGRADITAAVVMSKDLKIIPEEPPERHANIIGWSNDLSKQKMIALELASEAQLRLK